MLKILAILFVAPAYTAIDPAIYQKIGDQFEKVMRRGEPPKAPFMRRPVFAKSHGCVKAHFIINPKLEKEYRVGVFKGKKDGTPFPAWIRFSNDGGFGRDERKEQDGTVDRPARGMAIKVVGVGGKKILKGERDALTQDFVMQNHEVFFVNAAQDFLDFTTAALSGDADLNKKFNDAHPETGRIFADMQKNVLADPLDGTYWTPTPYKLGKYAMKYMAKPCFEAPNPSTKPTENEHFLRENLATHLTPTADSKESCMELRVQLKSKEDELDRATVPWKIPLEEMKLFATIKIPHGQNINDPDRERVCESLSMTGWHATKELEPLGSINEARKHVYRRMAKIRRERNNQEDVRGDKPEMPLEEPRTLVVEGL